MSGFIALLIHATLEKLSKQPDGCRPSGINIISKSRNRSSRSSGTLTSSSNSLHRASTLPLGICPALSPEFGAMWRDNDISGHHHEAVKHIRRPAVGRLAFEYSAFAVDGRTELAVVVYNPATRGDAERIKSLLT
jgi:hypothetical protein